MEVVKENQQLHMVTSVCLSRGYQQATHRFSDNFPNAVIFVTVEEFFYLWT